LEIIIKPELRIFNVFIRRDERAKPLISLLRNKSN